MKCIAPGPALLIGACFDFAGEDWAGVQRGQWGHARPTPSVTAWHASRRACHGTHVHNHDY
eukprot:183510-Chlamydomonas_euryale.AAC.2